MDHLTAALADRYALHRELGRGGMATVYLAHDRRHDRTVALKVLREEISAALGTDRFLQEIRITAGLNHPHILPLLDSGEAVGLLFYVMPYAAGGSLRHVLAHRSPMPLAVAVRVTADVAAALDHAHRHGIVHRDIKPENILFSEGFPLVADFGIAKAVHSAGREALTRSGFPLGTPGYMSPEQAAGHVALDARTDVFGLGCVIYEMLVGETPGLWPTEEAVRVGRFLDAVPAHRERLDGLPGRIEQALTKALAVPPGQRYASAGALASALAAAASPTDKLTDTRARAILVRAVQLDAGRSESTDLSLGGVEQVAAEVGIAPRHVRQAARDVATAGPSRSRYDRRTDSIHVDRTVDGRLDAAHHGILVDEIQNFLGIIGHVSLLRHTLVWSPATPGTESRKLVVTIRSRAGETRIHLEERFEIAGWRFVVPAWGAAGGGLLTLGLLELLSLPDAAAVMAIPLAIAGGFLSATGMLRGAASRRRPQLEELADRLAARVDKLALPAPTPTPS